MRETSAGWNELLIDLQTHDLSIAQMIADVAMRAALALLSKKGIFAVRMIWMMRVCVSRGSTNYPVFLRL